MNRESLTPSERHVWSVIRDDKGKALGSIIVRSGFWHAYDDAGRHLGTYATIGAAEKAVRA